MWTLPLNWRLASFFLVPGLLATIARSADEPLWNLPADLTGRTNQPSFVSSYEIGTWINPFYLRGDFDGDGKPDYALLIESKSERKKGFAIWLSSRPKSAPFVIGAGTQFNDTDDWTFFDVWQVHSSRVFRQGFTEEKPPKPLGESILVEKSESASGLIYWDGKRFRWYQQGD